MPHEITFEGDLMRMRLYGDLSTSGIASLIAEVARLEAESPVARHRLADLRDCNGVSLDFHAIHTLGRARSLARLPNPVKSAVIAPNPILYGFARMFQMLNANPSITVAIFPDEPTALAWLHEPGLNPPAKPWVPGDPAGP